MLWPRNVNASHAVVLQRESPIFWTDGKRLLETGVVILKEYRYGRCVSLIVFLTICLYQNLLNAPRIFRQYKNVLTLHLILSAFEIFWYLLFVFSIHKYILVLCCLLFFKVPSSLRPSNYRAFVYGSGALVFSNSSRVHYNDRSLMVFIQTDKVRYSAGQTGKYWTYLDLACTDVNRYCTPCYNTIFHL
jgi:hypothetical protein